MHNVHTRRTNKINDVIISHHRPTIYYNYTAVNCGVYRRGDGRVMYAGSGRVSDEKREKDNPSPGSRRSEPAAAHLSQISQICAEN